MINAVATKCYATVLQIYHNVASSSNTKVIVPFTSPIHFISTPLFTFISIQFFSSSLFPHPSPCMPPSPFPPHLPFSVRSENSIIKMRSTVLCGKVNKFYFRHDSSMQWLDYKHSLLFYSDFFIHILWRHFQIALSRSGPILCLTDLWTFQRWFHPVVKKKIKRKPRQS